jgi:hypothetical protein
MKKNMNIKKYLITYFVLLFVVVGFFVKVGTLHAGAPIGMGPAGKIDVFDWFYSVNSGCTPISGPKALMCVGGGVSSRPQGDTYYFTGWLANAAGLPVTTGMPIIGTLNDGFSTNCSMNLGVFQLVAFTWANRNASSISEVNCMTSFGTNGATNAPAGWFGHCASGDDSTATVCGWKSRSPFAKGGLLYLPVARQVGPGTPRAHDATMIVSPDSGAHWCNPYTIANRAGSPGCDSSNWQANGDAPLCGSVNASGGSNCLDAKYPGGIMWPNMAVSNLGVPLYNWNFYQYGQDGNLPTGVGGDCDPATYTCAMLDDGSVARVLNTDLPLLDVTKWQYVASTDAQYNPTWTSVYANRKPVVTFSPNSDSDLMRPRGSLSAPVYLKEFKSYILTGFKYSPDRIEFLASPSAFGPFKPIGIFPAYIGFNTTDLGVEYNVVSTNPPHVQVTVAADIKSATLFPGAPAGVPTFQKFDLVLGPQPGGLGDAPAYNDTSMGVVNSGWRFGSGEETGTFIRKGLAWAFDFMDHGGVIGSNYTFFHDVANGSAVLTPCYNDGGPASCGTVINNKGANLLTNGIQTQTGYSGRFESNVSDTNFGVTAGNQNAPASMQGDGTYTVVSVFRYDGGGSGQRTLWTTGDVTASGKSVALYIPNLSTRLALAWGGSLSGAFKWFNSNYSPTSGQWIFVATTVQGTGGVPIAHMWIGESGALVDELQGIAYTTGFGSPVTTPIVTPGILTLSNPTINASYAGLMIYNRAISNLEAQQLYQSFKIKMNERGISIQ